MLEELKVRGKALIGRQGAKRRRTLTRLNRGEDWHELAHAVFHGKREELRQRYREGPSSGKLRQIP